MSWHFSAAGDFCFRPIVKLLAQKHLLHEFCDVYQKFGIPTFTFYHTPFLLLHTGTQNLSNEALQSAQVIGSLSIFSFPHSVHPPNHS